ncbi:hypothetical protein N2152v2_008048, partial [Parachlorella kessleri]
MKFCNADQDATTDIQDAGTCILSRSKDGQKVILFEEGDGVTWTGGRYVANDDGKLPSPSGSPPLTPPGKSPSPSSNSTEACPVHEVPTDLALSASQTSVNWFVGLSGARAPPCYDVEKDDFIESPASYAPCRLAGEATKNALAQKLCDGTIGVGDDADVAVAQSIFFSAIQAGGQEAIDAVDALLYAQLVLNCWQGDTVSIVISPPHDEITGTTPHDTISNLVGFFVDVANAAEYAGMGICTTLVTTHDDDISTRKLLTRVHTAINTFDLVMGNHLKGLTKTNSLQASASGKAQKAGAVPFTNTENTYYRGPEVLITKEGLHTPGECLSLCLVDTRCEFWTHCPAKSADGCGVVEFSTVERDVTTRTMHPGTCILSRSTKRGQKELLTMEGEDVLWSGGYYSPGGFVETPSSSSASSLDAPLTPALPGDCPEHKPPTNWRLR